MAAPSTVHGAIFFLWVLATVGTQGAIPHRVRTTTGVAHRLKLGCRAWLVQSLALLAPVGALGSWMASLLAQRTYRWRRIGTIGTSSEIGIVFSPPWACTTTNA